MTEEEKWHAEFEELGPAEVRRLINVFYWREGSTTLPCDGCTGTKVQNLLVRKRSAGGLSGWLSLGQLPS